MLPGCKVKVIKFSPTADTDFAVASGNRQKILLILLILSKKYQIGIHSFSKIKGSQKWKK